MGLAFILLELMLLFWLVKLCWSKVQESKKMPPGPYGLPLVGYMPFMGNKPYLTFERLAKKYGNIFRVRLGTQHIVVLTSLDVIKEAYMKMEFAGRPSNAALRAFIESGPSRFAFKTADAKWKFLRKTAIKSLSLFASSRNSHLDTVLDQTGQQFTQQIQQQSNKGPFDPQPTIFQTVAAIIGAVLFGDNFHSNDALLQPLIDNTTRVSKFLAVGTILDSFPFGAFIMKKKIREFKEGIKPLNMAVEKQVREHEVHIEDEQQIRDVADALAFTAVTTPDSAKCQFGVTDQNIRELSYDLFGAGFGTTMETFRWAVNLLAVCPDVQLKAHHQLSLVCGQRPMSLNDRSKIPYVEAILLEVLRFSSLIPLGIPHSTIADTELGGYSIPEGVTVFANFYAHHHNPQIFPSPHHFRPERFITSDGRLDLDGAQKVVPFSVGKRRCTGENLARQELSVLIGRLLQSFHVSEHPAHPVIVSDARPGFARFPTRTKLIFRSI